jgi:hypothetical protein
LARAAEPGWRFAGGRAAMWLRWDSSRAWAEMRAWGISEVQRESSSRMWRKREGTKGGVMEGEREGRETQRGGKGKPDETFAYKRLGQQLR